MPRKNATSVSGPKGAAMTLVFAGYLGACHLEAQAPGPPAAAAPESVLFETMPVVEAATLHAQTLEEAPASTTVISEKDIRTYGWRTLGEALAAVRGFYVTYD